MTKKIDLERSGLGDISSLLHNRGLSDLSWLDIDPEDYHKAEALPKQNLDAIPELQRALTFDDGDVPSLIPLRPHTMVNTNPLDPPGAPSRNVAKEIVNRIARCLISGMKPKEIGERISLEFAPLQIRDASEQISTVLSERGLLGNVYIDARHFPRCAQDSDDKKFVVTRATSAKYVLAKNECMDCVHNNGGMCSNLHKQLVDRVSYDRKVFAHYAIQLASEKRLDKAALDGAIGGTNDDRRKLLQSCFNAEAASPIAVSSNFSLRHYGQEKKTTYTDDQIAEYLSRPRKKDATISNTYAIAAKHLTFGGSPDILIASVDPEIRRLASHHGLLGHTYLDMDAIGGCSRTLAVMRKMGHSPDFVVRRSACCKECMGAPDGACCQIQDISPIVDEVDIQREHLASALVRAAHRGAISMEMARRAATKAPDGSNWAKLTAQANLLVPNEKKEVPVCSSKVSAHYGTPVSRGDTAVSNVDPEDIRRTISHMMNSGMNGKALTNAILQRYTRSDLSQVPELGVHFASLDGVQGSYFVDPTAYTDYGSGCSVGSKQFRKRGAKYLMAGSSCTGCTSQTAPGWCTKYSKPLIRQIPKAVFEAVASAKNAPPPPPAPIRDPAREYQLAAEEMVVEPVKRSPQVEIKLPDKSITK